MRIVFILLAMSLTPTQAAEKTEWPRTFVNADGSETVISNQPKRILSSSVTISGTLLALEAPLVASASAVTGQFFGQWASLAKQRQVANIWPAGSVDLEMAYVYRPDLIVVSASGADSAMAQRSEFEKIAPTIVVDYSGQTWQSFTYHLSKALGLEQRALQAISDFDRYVEQSRERLQLPKGKANIISYHGAGAVNAIAKGNGAHGQLFKALGFDLETPNPEWDTGVMNHKDFLTVHYESLTELQGSMTFLLRSNDEQAQRLSRDPVLKNLLSVQNQQIYGLGENSFRIDLLSAREIVEDMVARFGAPQS